LAVLFDLLANNAANLVWTNLYHGVLLGGHKGLMLRMNLVEESHQRGPILSAPYLHKRGRERH